MFLTARIKRPFVAFILIFSLSFNGLLYAQHKNYVRQETNLSTEELLDKAQNMDFGDNLSAEIFGDEKNAYYAVDVSKLSSAYEKIRILELGFSNNTLVVIGSDKNTGFYLFLVNNTLNKTTKDVNNLFDRFLTQSKAELKELNDEQLRLWLIQHDKYSKK